MLKPNYVPPGGFNLEYRQDANNSDGFIYSYTGSNAEVFLETAYHLFPKTIAFAADSSGAVTADNPGTSPIESSAIIWPYPGKHPSYLPSQFTIMVGDKSVDCMLIAKNLSMLPMPSTNDSTWYKIRIERHTQLTIIKGQVLQELVGEDGSRYALASVTEDGASEYHVDQLGGLKKLPLPDGYTYESRELTENFVMSVEQIAHIITDQTFLFQRYDT